MGKIKYRYAPAMVNERLSRFYDVCVDAACVGRKLQRRTLQHIDLQPGQSMLDVGCGTGTLAIMAKQRFPKSKIAGIDPGASVMKRANKKASRKKLSIDLRQGGAESLPFDTHSLDVVTSSLAFHHMPLTIKRQALTEIMRVLRSDGLFLLVDIGKPRSKRAKILCRIESLLEPRAYLQDNLDGKIPQLIEEAGFHIHATHDPYLGIYTWECRKAS